MFESYNKAQRAVLQTTLRIINEKELQATSMALIAKESGISTGSIYHYFTSKEDIINELYKGIVTFNGTAVMKGVSDGQPVRERFDRAWDNLIRLSMTHPEGFLFIEQYSFSPYIYPASKEEAYKGGWCAPMEKLYAEASTEGIFLDMKPSLMVQMHYGSIVYLVKGHLQGNFELTDEAIRQVIDCCWNAVIRR